MVRHLVRVASAMLAGLPVGIDRSSGGTGVGRQYGGILNDPFSFYYAIYLPNQQFSRCVQGRWTRSITRWSPGNTSHRLSDGDCITRSHRTRTLTIPLTRTRNRARNARPSIPVCPDPSNADGNGPSLYYNRVVQYYPNLEDDRPVGRMRMSSAPQGRLGPGRVALAAWAWAWGAWAAAWASGAWAAAWAWGAWAAAWAAACFDRQWASPGARR